MSTDSTPSFTLTDSLKEFFLRFAASGVIPGRWFNTKLPPEQERHRAELPLTLEIVSHCWKYSEFQLYQLSSLVNHPPTQLNIVHTIYYSKSDADTVRILNFFENKTINNVRWNFIALPKEQLFRRAIGRNMAALNTTADWIWFTDCDVVFHQGALDTLAQQLAGRTDALVYPRTMYITQLLKKDDPLITKAKADLEVLEIDTSELSTRYFTRATGPIQITHGDVARACGYCADLAVYQKPMPRWSKCYEDRAFRWLLGTKGTPIDVPNLLFIRHAEKGRYQQDSKISKARKTVRRVKSALINK